MVVKEGNECDDYFAVYSWTGRTDCLCRGFILSRSGVSSLGLGWLEAGRKGGGIAVLVSVSVSSLAAAFSFCWVKEHSDRIFCLAFSLLMNGMDVWMCVCGVL